ncbi:MAG TPA: hypothetical protein VFQ36_00565 [Ktedonobacteraceae bacterium]|nr:hypothetical protein [Ktedonobacteraceae bacterium]
MSQDQGAESSAAFRTYLRRFGLSRLDVARAARVWLLTVWKIEQGLPIRAEDALAVCAGLHHLTGVSYTALIPVVPAEILWMTQTAQARRTP